MSNTITISAFAENLYRAKDTVARELTGFIPSVLVNSSPDGASINGTITSLVTTQPTLNTSVTPAMTIPAGDDQTISALTMTIGQTANVRIPMVGETWKKLQNTAGGQNTLDDLLAQGLRVIVNAIESHVGTVAKNGASRAVGTAGTTPFASTHAVIPQAHQILKDNGAPEDGQLSLVLSTGAETNLKSLANLFKANESGDTALLRQGVLSTLDGVMIRPTAGAASHTAGTMASATSTSAAFTVGQTVIPLATAGTGVVAAGDVITFANDTNPYVVSAVSFAGANPASGDTITLASPGLRKAQSAATRAITVTATYTANPMFHRNAIELVVRPPAMPPGGDQAIDMITLVDSKSGLVFQVAIYGGYKMQLLDITTYYQAKVWKPDFVATILG